MSLRDGHIAHAAPKEGRALLRSSENRPLLARAPPLGAGCSLQDGSASEVVNIDCVLEEVPIIEWSSWVEACLRRCSRAVSVESPSPHASEGLLHGFLRAQMSTSTISYVHELGRLITGRYMMKALKKWHDIPLPP
jgi:hypothetical protein